MIKMIVKKKPPLLLLIISLLLIWAFVTPQETQFSEEEIAIANQMILSREISMEEIPAFSHYFDEMPLVSAIATSTLVKVKHVDSNLSYYYFKSTILRIPITKSRIQYKNGQIHSGNFTVPSGSFDEIYLHGKE